MLSNYLSSPLTPLLSLLFSGSLDGPSLLSWLHARLASALALRSHSQAQWQARNSWQLAGEREGEEEGGGEEEGYEQPRVGDEGEGGGGAGQGEARGSGKGKRRRWRGKGWTAEELGDAVFADFSLVDEVEDWEMVEGEAMEALLESEWGRRVE